MSQHFNFLFHAPATPESYTLSLHDALPISSRRASEVSRRGGTCSRPMDEVRLREDDGQPHCQPPSLQRSEEHTSELQSQSNLVCRLLLEKKKTKKNSIAVH